MHKIITRRKFLNDLAVQVSGFVALPSLATLLYNGRALAANACAKPQAINKNSPAFIALDLQGGASIAGNNLMVYDNGGELLSDYRGLGLPPDLHPSKTGMLNSELGLPFHAYSPMLKGIKSVATPAVLAKVNGCVICTQSADDTSNNRLATAPGIFLAGVSGKIVPLVGTNPSFPGGSGGNSVTPFSSGVTPALISDIKSAQQLISAGEFWARSPQKMAGVLALIEGMSSAQLKRFSQLSLPEQARKMIECGYLDAAALLDPNRSDSGVVTADNLDPNKHEALRGKSFINDQQFAAAIEIAYLIMEGYAGAGTIALGGYDYHDGSATTGEERDEQAGKVIGIILAMAAALKRKTMLHVYTDGGVDADSNRLEEVGNNGAQKYIWRGDSEARSAAFVLIYDPNARPAVSFQQLGAYKANDGGTVNLTPEKHAKISQAPIAQAAAVLANWLAWQGKEGELNTIMKDSPLRPEEVEDYLFVRK
ncbi:MAG: hypothetical protein OYH77_08890 [Pseudomonadota bacterium]|nr:hypothetical protein [Pseudomonadota bacterium]